MKLAYILLLLAPAANAVVFPSSHFRQYQFSQQQEQMKLAAIGDRDLPVPRGVDIAATAAAQHAAALRYLENHPPIRASWTISRAELIRSGYLSIMLGNERFISVIAWNGTTTTLSTYPQIPIFHHPNKPLVFTSLVKQP